MNKNAIEAVLGFVVLVVAALFLTAGWMAGNSRSVGNGTYYSAEFRNVDGLTKGAVVRLGGVNIGQITHIKLNTQKYTAELKLSLADDLKIPEDSELKIMSDGIMGGKYLQLIPGNANKTLSKGAAFTITHDMVSLEDLLSRAIFMVGQQSK